MRILTIIALVFLFASVFINFIPASAYYFGTALHEKHQGSFSNGLWLIYIGTYSPGPSFNSSYGFVINVTKLNASYYLVQSKLYLLYGNEVSCCANSNPPFEASKVEEIYNYSAVLNINNSTFLQILFPHNNVVRTNIVNISISNSTTTYPSPRPPYSFLGYTNLYHADIQIYPTIPAFIPTDIYYVLYGSQHVLSLYLSSPSSNLDRELFMSMFPHYHFNQNLLTYRGSLFIQLAYGNGIPNQDWTGWLGFGFSRFASLDMLLIISALVIALYDQRKHKIG